MQKLLVTGATGLLGSYVAEECSQKFDVFGLSRSSAPSNQSWKHEQIDLTDATSLSHYLETIRPEAIVHSAGMTEVDRCEPEPQQAWAANVDATETLARWCWANRAEFVFISTDSVFDGVKGNYCEEDAARPLNVYARTKLAAERLVLSGCPNALVVRTNFFGWSRARRSIAEWMLEQFAKREGLTAFADVRFSPLFAGELAKIIQELIYRGAIGVFHVATRDSCSKYKFAQMLAEQFGFPEAAIEPIPMNDAHLMATRPKDTSLSTKKISACIGREMPTVEDGVKIMAEDAQAYSRVLLLTDTVTRGRALCSAG